VKEASAALVLPSLSLIFVAIFVALWRKDPLRRHLLGYAFAFFALFLAMSFHIAIPSMNTSITVPITHGVASVSIIAIAWSSCNRLGQSLPIELMLFVALVSCVLIFFALDSSKESVALAVQNGASGVLFGIGAMALWFARPTDFLDKVLIFTMGAIATVGLTRPAIMILLDVDVERLVQRQDDFSVVGLILLTVLTVILGLSLVAIAVREALEIRLGSPNSDTISGFLDQQSFDRASVGLLAKARDLKMPVSLAIIQLDWFEAVREKWGEHSSDAIIRQVADVMRTWQRESDIIGRVGENRFGILLVGASEKSALKVVQELRDALDASCNDGLGRSMKFTVSISLAGSRAGRDFVSLFVVATRPLGEARARAGNVSFVNGNEVQVSNLLSNATDIIGIHE
jgi:diguanylate cyclase (GGDEF)-like protein